MSTSVPTPENNTLDLDAANVFQADLTVADARALVDELGDAYDDLASELDEAQGKVFSGGAELAYVVITIVK